MKHAPAHAHAAPVTDARGYAEQAQPAVSEFAALLGGAVGQAASAASAAPAEPAEPTVLDGLLAKPMASGKRRRLVVCGQCGDPKCSFSYYV